jgi:thiaminase/transcriptional activator TenA
MLHDTLWNENAELVRRCLEHPFVRGLADGTLNRAVFRHYVAQDAFFLRTFLKAYALAAAKCDDFEGAQIFHELMSGVLDELKLHASYSRDPKQPRPGPRLRAGVNMHISTDF